MTITSEQLDLHAKWLRGEPDGVRLVIQDANLRGADLWGANLWGARGLCIAADASERLQAVAAAALSSDDALRMEAWHTCTTTHCLAGWAIHQAGEPGRLLEQQMGAQIAGLMLLGVEAHSHFFDSDDDAREYLKSVLEGSHD